MCWAGCTATRDRGARPQDPPNLYHPTTDRSARRQTIPPHQQVLRSHLARAALTAFHPMISVGNTQRVASVIATHCIGQRTALRPERQQQKGIFAIPRTKTGSTPKENGEGSLLAGKMSFRHHKIAMRELQKCLFCIERVLKGTFFSTFLFKCKTSEKQLFVTLWRKMPVWPLMSQGCAEAV